MRARVFVTLKPSVFDPQGKTIADAMEKVAGVLSEDERVILLRLLKKLGKDETKVDITRFKGLGEMMPKVLWETTLSPKSRRLLRVEIADALQTDKVINQLMGKDPAERFQFIMEHAEDAVDIDV